MPRKPKVRLQYAFYTCPICGARGSIMWTTETPMPYETATACDCKVPIIVGDKPHEDAKSAD